MSRIETIETADGRTLAFAQWGDPHGDPIFNIHGTPGCRLNRHPTEAKIAELGVRLITYDRPGYGQSSRHHGRSVNDCVSDILAIINSLAIDRFAVTGGSGGGPHSLAVAAALPDRVTRCGCIVGIAPYDVLGDRFFEKMDPQNIKEFGWALDGEDRLRQEVPREAKAMLDRMAGDPTTILGAFELPEADKAILARKDIQDLMRVAMTETFANGVDGWIDDDLAFTKPWGFDPASITVETAVWWGAEDVLVPPVHGEWLAATVPGSIPRVDTSGGHQADPDTFIQALYPWLTRGILWPDTDDAA
jgi:pimeloyl-ACP methyl ester carboxylesterase